MTARIITILLLTTVACWIGLAIGQEEGEDQVRIDADVWVDNWRNSGVRRSTVVRLFFRDSGVERVAWFFNIINRLLVEPVP